MANPATRNVSPGKLIALAALALAIFTTIIVLVPGGSAAPLVAVPADVQAKLRGEGIEVAAANVDAAVPADKAVARSRSLPGVGEQEPEVVLVTFTDSIVGTRTSEEGGELARSFVDRPAWLVIYRGTTQPIFGPWRKEASGPTEYVADLAVFIDASTGDLLEALTL